MLGFKKDVQPGYLQIFKKWSDPSPIAFLKNFFLSVISSLLNSSSFGSKPYKNEFVLFKRFSIWSVGSQGLAPISQIYIFESFLN